MIYKVLMIEMANPFGVGGGSFASLAHLYAFSHLFNGNIDICVADTCPPAPKDLKCNNIYRVPARSKLNRYLSVFTGELHRYTSFVKSILRKKNREYDICVFDGNQIGGSLVDFVKSVGIKTITINHNYEPEYFLDNSKSKLQRILFYHHVRRAESRSFKRSDCNLFLTESDKRKFISEYGYSESNQFVIGTFEYKHSPDTSKSYTYNKTKPIVLSITGSLCTPQGVDGIRYFFSECYPLLPKDCHIIIAGRTPIDEVFNLCRNHNNVELIPSPPDMLEIIYQSDIYICPTRLGSGLKLRVMDGLRLGKPILCYEKSVRGYERFLGKQFFISFSNPKEFKDGYNNLVDKLKQGVISSKQIKEEYKDCFSFESGVRRLEEIVNVIIKNTSVH